MTADSSPSAAQPGLLHNMSSKPRTQVAIRIDPIDAGLGSFSLDDLGPQLSRLGQGRTRATRRETLAAFVCRGDVARLTERLDQAWALLALRGAILLYPGGSGCRSPRAPACRDPLVVLNVLARARATCCCPTRRSCCNPGRSAGAS